LILARHALSLPRDDPKLFELCSHPDAHAQRVTPCGLGECDSVRQLVIGLSNLTARAHAGRFIFGVGSRAERAAGDIHAERNAERAAGVEQ